MTLLRIASLAALLLGAGEAVAEMTHKNFGSWSIDCDTEMKSAPGSCVIRQKKHVREDQTQWAMLEIRHSDSGLVLEIYTSPGARFGGHVTLGYVKGGYGLLPIQCDAKACKGEWSLGAAEIQKLRASEGVSVGFNQSADIGWRVLFTIADFSSALEELARLDPR